MFCCCNGLADKAGAPGIMPGILPVVEPSPCGPGVLSKELDCLLIGLGEAPGGGAFSIFSWPQGWAGQTWPVLPGVV